MKVLEINNLVNEIVRTKDNLQDLIMDVLILVDGVEKSIKEIENKLKIVKENNSTLQQEYQKLLNTYETLAFKLFGKRKKDLTQEELKEYIRISVNQSRQRNRDKRNRK